MNYLGLRSIALDAVDDTLGGFVREQQQRIPGTDPHGPALWDEVLEHTRSGKRLRSRLVLLAAAGSQASGAVHAVAAAYGLLHASFVLHDDVIDRDAMRYGRPSLHAAHAAGAVDRGLTPEAAMHRGYSRSILAGDLALAAAHHLLLSGTADCPVPVRERLLQILHDTVLSTTLGELLDVELSIAPRPAEVLTAATSAGSAPGGRPEGRAADSRALSLRTMELKTAVYTFRAPLMSGALLGGLDAQQVDAVGRIGMHLGVAFQVEDDVQGVYGDARDMGKPVGGDLREGKHTHLVASALMSDRAEQVRELLGRAACADDEQLAEVTAAMRDLLQDCGALEESRATIREHTARARQELSALALPPRLARALRSLADEIGRGA